IALVRIVPERWEALLAAVLIATIAVSGYAVLTKILPGSLAADEIASRLRAPYGYWNATGLIAGLGIPACLWLGTRRQGHQALAASRSRSVPRGGRAPASGAVAWRSSW